MNGARASRQQEKLLDALSVVLQHSAVAADPRSICTLQRVSTGIRSLVQQSATGATDVSCTLRITNWHLPKLPRLAAWLSKHLELVGSLHIKWCIEWIMAPEVERVFQAAAQQLIESSLKGPVTSCGKQTTAESAAATAATQACRLRSYSSNIPVTVGVLKALPPDTLTQLHVVVPKGDDWVSSVSRLRHLRDLKLEPAMWYEELPHACVPAIYQLTRLTKLFLIDPSQDAADNLQLLPKQLKDLVLTMGNNNTTSPRPVTLNLQHLEQLERLQLTSCRNSACTKGSGLPTQLKHLKLDVACPVIRALGLTKLQQLETLCMDTSTEVAAVRGLAVLGSIKHMALSSKRGAVDLDEAAAWKHLPKLQELTVHVADDIDLPVDEQFSDCQLLVQHIAAATQLTQLKVSQWCPSELVICNHITTLTRLKELTLVECFAESTHGAECLTALKALTHLAMLSSDIAVGESTVAVLASELTNLQRLQVTCCPLDNAGTVAFPAIGRLTKLERLVLQDITMSDAPGFRMSGAEACDGLLMLTGLVGLTQLLGFESAGPVALDAFWSVLRRQHHTAQK